MSHRDVVMAYLADDLSATFSGDGQQPATDVWERLSAASAEVGTRHMPVEGRGKRET